MPLAVSDGAAGLGTEASAGKLTVLVYPDAAPSAFTLHDEDDAVTTLEAEATAAGARVGLSRALRETLLRIRVEAAPAGVEVDGQAAPAHATREAFDAAASGHYHDAATKALWVKVPAGDGPREVEVL